MITPSRKVWYISTIQNALAHNNVPHPCQLLPSSPIMIQFFISKKGKSQVYLRCDYYAITIENGKNDLHLQHLDRSRKKRDRVIKGCYRYSGESNVMLAVKNRLTWFETGQKSYIPCTCYIVQTPRKKTSIQPYKLPSEQVSSGTTPVPLFQILQAYHISCWSDNRIA